jgi:hypothetical protein
MAAVQCQVRLACLYLRAGMPMLSGHLVWVLMRSVLNFSCPLLFAGEFTMIELAEMVKKVVNPKAEVRAC